MTDTFRDAEGDTDDPPVSNQAPVASHHDGATVETVPAAPAPLHLPPGARWRNVRIGGGGSIGFILRRSRRGTIGLAIGDEGLRITAPRWVTLRQIDKTVLEKSAWIIDKLAWHRARQERLARADAQWREGGCLPYLGVPIVLRLAGACAQSAYHGDVGAPRPGDTLCLTLPPDADRNQIRESTQSWLKQRAHSWFGQRLIHFQKISGLSINHWRLSSATTRWGSCNSKGGIRLNWRLIHFDATIVDYVIAHELAHLNQMNHSAEFWREVDRILPGFEVARDILRQHTPAALPLL